MSTEVLGLFDSRTNAEHAEHSLKNAGFSHSEIKLRSQGDDGAASKLTSGQILIEVTTSDNVTEDNAIRLLRENGAVKINEITQQFHAENAKN